MLKIIYPKNNSKVSNQEVCFSWTPVDDAVRYYIAVFSLEKGRQNYEWRPVFSATPTDPKFCRYLATDKFYFCCVYSNATSSESRYGTQVIRRGPDIPYHFVTVPPPPVPDEYRESFNYCETYFYVKKKENYLQKYFQIKASRLKPDTYLKPAVPLMFALLERYVKGIENPDAVNLTELDQKFCRTIEELSGGLRSRDRLIKLVENYQSPQLKELKKQLFGPDFAELPSASDFEEWSQNCLNEMFADSWLKKLRNSELARKTMDLEFKYSQPLSVRNIDLAKELKIPIDKNSIGSASDQLNPEFLYSLRIISFNDTELARIDLRLISDENGNYFLYSPTTVMNSYNSAAYKAELWGRDANSENEVLWGYNGVLSINGGIPIVLSAIPPSAPEQSTADIKVKVRDGGQGKQIILKGQSESYRIPRGQSPYLNMTEQSLEDQTFIFKLSDADPQPPGPGIYDLYFLNMKEKSSLNSIKFHVKGYEYRVWVKHIKCIDESNPEWWGNDTISFETFISTHNFLQLPASCKINGGFKDGTCRSSFADDANYVYPIDARFGGRRIIEDYIDIGIAIYEHDDLGWLGDLINEIVDMVQSYLAHMVDAFTFGLGGYLILAGLEISGVNDMREQAVDTMVSGWEIEILHEGQVTMNPPSEDLIEYPLRMKTKESEYQVTFVIDRQLQA
jgi:hypothetical protein